MNPEPRYVWFRNFDGRTPVFHVPTTTGRTRCGLVAWDGLDARPGCLIPTRFARLFAKPCTRCWRTP